MNIENYVFTDVDLKRARIVDDEIFLDDADYEISVISLNKEDVIAMAKHFKLTTDDLEDQS